ncbi:MAG: hypothetical protein RL563_2176 [Pseudomonadota bacterium]
MSKVVLITGAAKRIGAACVRILHSEGFNIVLHYHHSEPEAIKLAAELNALRLGSVFIYKADLLVMDEVQSLVSNASCFFGGVDVLINNASAFYPTPMGQVSEFDWGVVMGSNLKAPFFLSQSLGSLLADRQGCIVNIVDIHAERGLPGYSVYSIAKAGLVAMTRCLAKELAPNIRVNAVAPGAILWPEAEISDYQKAEILSKVALARCGSEMDIAKAVRFLVMDADYVNGQVLAVDGGRLLFS